MNSGPFGNVDELRRQQELYLSARAMNLKQQKQSQLNQMLGARQISQQDMFNLLGGGLANMYSVGPVFIAKRKPLQTKLSRIKRRIRRMRLWIVHTNTHVPDAEPNDMLRWHKPCAYCILHWKQRFT